MKIQPELYEQLKSDLESVAEHCRVVIRKDTGLPVLWALLHEVNAQRSYDDDHPRWQKRERFLPPTHIGKACWLNELYNTGLFDQHIETALKKVAQDQKC